jgi:hypothetical protein
VAVALAAGLGLACASPIETEHDQSPAADFSRYATYAWIDEESHAGAGVGPGGRRGDAAMVRRAVDAQLAARGYRPAAADAADLLVGFEVGSEQKVVEEPVPGRATVYTGGYSYGTWYRSAPMRTRTYTEGTLSLAFFERGSREAVWVGWASKRITGADEPEPLIQDAVARILQAFPARSQPEPRDGSPG